MFFHLVTSMKQRTNSESQWGIEPQCLKTYHLPYSIYKHEAINIADPGCMQDVCHVNFVIDLTHHRVSLAQWQSIGAQNPKF